MEKLSGRIFRFWGVRTKLLLSFVLLTAISTGVFFYISYVNTRSMAHEHITQKIKLLSLVFTEEIRNEISTANLELERIAADSDILDLNESELKSYIETTNPKSTFSSIIFFETNGYPVSELSYGKKNPDLLSKLYGHRAVLEAIKKKKTVIFEDETNTAPAGSVIICTTIIGGNGKPIGAIAGATMLDTSGKENITRKRQTAGEGAKFYLIDSRGNYINTRKKTLSKPDLFSELYRTAKINSPDGSLESGLHSVFRNEFTFKHNGDKYIGASKLVDPRIGWHVVIVQPYKNAILPVAKVGRTIFLLGLLAISVSIYLALYRAKRIIDPISELIEAAERISNGDYSKRVEVRRRDEFGWLGLAFNHMSADLREKILELQDSKNKLQEYLHQVENDAQKREEANRQLQDSKNQLQEALQKIQDEAAKREEANQELYNANQELYNANRELSRKVSELASLSEVTQAITTSLDINEVLNTIADTVGNVMGFELCSIKLLKDTNKLHTVLSRGLGEDYESRDDTPLGEGISGLAAKMSRSIFVKDVKEDRRIPTDHPIREMDIVSIISIPLVTKSSVMGVFNLYTREKHEFTKDEIRLLGIFANQAASAIENAQLFDNLRENYLNTIQALSIAIDAKDEYTHGHSKRVREFSLVIGKAMNLTEPQIELLTYASDLHDIGKIGISELILGKEAKLSVDEYQIIKTHPLVGATIIEPVPFLREISPIIKHHHERYDGYGYPDGLKEDETPLLARIIHLADAFDAMTSDRPYRKAMSRQAALEEIKKHAGTQFDPVVVGAFVRVFDSFKIESKRTGSTKRGV